MDTTSPAAMSGTSNGKDPEWRQVGPGEPVRYGPGPDQAVPHSWAEAMLTALATDRPKVFAELMGRAALPGAAAH